MLNLSAGGDPIGQMRVFGGEWVRYSPLDWTEAFKGWYGQD